MFYTLVNTLINSLVWSRLIHSCLTFIKSDNSIKRLSSQFLSHTSEKLAGNQYKKIRYKKYVPNREKKEYPMNHLINKLNPTYFN